MGYKGHKY